MRIFALLAAPALPAAPALADTPEGYYASGWPIALAEAACEGDEGCLTLLANCGPGAACGDTAALCLDRRTADAADAAYRPCALHWQADDRILVNLPGGGDVFVSEDPSLFDGKEAGIDGYLGSGSACWYVDYEPQLCVSLLRSAKDLEPWAPE